MTELLLAYALVVLRVAAFIGFGPLRFSVPDRFVRFAVAIALSLAWFTEAPRIAAFAAGEGGSALIWLLLAGREAVFGWSVGFVAALYVLPAQVAGDLIGRNMGINLGQIADPITSTPLSLVPQVFQLLALLVFYAADVHHTWLLLLDTSFKGWTELLPALFLRPDLAAEGIQAAYDGGIAIAGILLLIGFALLTAVALLARAVPGFNYFSLGLGTQILGALVALYVFTPAIIAAMLVAAANWSSLASRLLGGP